MCSLQRANKPVKAQGQNSFFVGFCVLQQKQLVESQFEFRKLQYFFKFLVIQYSSLSKYLNTK